MNFPTAKNYASHLYTWLLPYAAPFEMKVNLQIAGSVRRERPVCNDIDLVMIPRVTEERDLLGNVAARTNHALKFLQEYVAASAGKARFNSGGEREGKSVIVELPKCQLDLWFADERTQATRLLCRTGSKEHNIWLATRAKRLGKKWNPYEGVLTGGEWRRIGEAEEYAGGHLQPAQSEADIYGLLDLPFIEPRDREIHILNGRFGA